mgnify:CR=1 FL=1
MSKPQIGDIDKIIAEDVLSTPSKERKPANLLFAEEREYFNQQTEILKEELKDKQHYRDLRKTYADRVFNFMCIWCIVVFLIVIADAISVLSFFHIDTSVLCTLIGGTTISVIGLVGFMMQGLFHSNGTNQYKS